MAELSERYNRKENYYLYDTYWGDGYNWLALGNSLTLINDWGRGICSTKLDNDYFGLVKKELESRYDEVSTFRYNYAVWERSEERKSEYDLIEEFLDPRLDLVTIQLGENTSDLSTYETDLGELVDFIRTVAPDAQIIIIDDFWSQEKSDIRKAVANDKGCGFADLSDIRGKSEYQSQTGIICEMPDGSTESVPEEAATHPGDEGMAVIAERILQLVEYNLNP